jgi:hypothetical protein
MRHTALLDQSIGQVKLMACELKSDSVGGVVQKFHWSFLATALIKG